MNKYRFYKNVADGYYSLWLWKEEEKLWHCLKTNKDYDPPSTDRLCSIGEWNRRRGRSSREFETDKLEDVLEKVFVDIL